MQLIIVAMASLHAHKVTLDTAPPSVAIVIYASSHACTHLYHLHKGQKSEQQLIQLSIAATLTSHLTAAHRA